MQEKNVARSLRGCLNRRLPGRIRRGLAGAALLTLLALAAVAVNHLVPNLPGRESGYHARMSWYVHHGQLQADARTLAAAVQYLLTPDGDLPAAINPTDQAIAGSAAPSKPKS